MTALRYRCIQSALGRLVSVLAICCASAAFFLPARVPGAIVTGNFQDVTSKPYGGDLNTALFKPVASPQKIGTNTIWPPTVSTTITTNGQFAISLVGGWYTVTVQTIDTTSLAVAGLAPALKIFVPPLDTNVYNINTLATNLGTFVFSNQLLIALAPGNNVTFITNSGVVTISSTGGSGGTATNVPAVVAGDATILVGSNVVSGGITSWTVKVPANTFAPVSVTNLTPAQLAIINAANGVTNLTQPQVSAITLSISNEWPTAAGQIDLLNFSILTDKSWYLNDFVHGNPSGSITFAAGQGFLDDTGNGFMQHLSLSSLPNGGSGQGNAGLNIGDHTLVHGDWNAQSDDSGTLKLSRFGTPGLTNDLTQVTINDVGDITAHKFIGNGAGLTGVPITGLGNAALADTNTMRSQYANNAVQATNALSVPASGITGAIPLALLPSVITNTIIPNGVNDSIAMQAAASIPFSVIRLIPWQTYYFTNIFFTNYVFVDGNYAIAKFILGCTNAMFSTASNGVANSFSHIIFEGQEGSNYQTAATIAVPLNNPEIYGGPGISVFGSSVTSRTGLRWNAGGGGFVEGCQFNNFSGIGFLAFNYWGTQAMLHTNGLAHNLTFFQDFIGAYSATPFWSGYPSYLNDSGSFAANSAEYLALNNCKAVSCGIGFHWAAGNADLNNCIAASCFIGVAGGGGANAGHGQFIGLKLNHNTYPFQFSAGPYNLFDTVCLANTLPGLVCNGASVDFFGCYLGVATTASQPAVTVTNGGSSASSRVGLHNGFLNTTTIGATVWVVSASCAAFFNGNCDTFGDNDGTFASGLGFITNSTTTGTGVLTYLGITGASVTGVVPLAGNLQTISTNTITTNNASQLNSGTVAAARMPAFTGDVTTSAGSVATALKSTGSAGTYTKTTFDAQGRETSGTTLAQSDLPLALTNWIAGNGLPDMSKPYQSIGTNQSFTLALPANVIATAYNFTAIDVTNRLGSLITITPPASWHIQGTWNVTNETVISIFVVGNLYTNAICYPLW